MDRPQGSVVRWRMDRHSGYPYSFTGESYWIHMHLENGTITVNNPESTNFGKISRGDQFNMPEFSAVIIKVRERRFPIADEERGLVYAIISLDHAGIPEAKSPDGTVRPLKLSGSSSVETACTHLRNG